MLRVKRNLCADMKVLCTEYVYSSTIQEIQQDNIMLYLFRCLVVDIIRHFESHKYEYTTIVL